MDIFYEYIVKRKKETKDYLIIAGIIVLGLILSVVLLGLTIIFSTYLSGLGLVLIFLLWWGAWTLMGSRNLEYEYILTNNYLDIDKIIARRGRKRLCTINFKEIEQCASTTDPMFGHIYRNTEGRTVKNYAGDINAPRVYFVDFSKDAERVRVLFQPNERILDGLKKANPRLVAVKEGDL